MTTRTDRPDPLEELELPHLKDRLWQELAQLQAEHRGPETVAYERGAALVQWRARRSLRIAGIGAAAAAVLVVGLLAAQLVGTGTDQPTSPDADAVLLERIAVATDEALEESVVHRVNDQVLPGGQRSTLETWHDETTGIARMLVRDEQGNPVHDVGPLAGPTVDSPDYSGQRLVDYCTQSYIEHLDTGGASTNVGAGVVDVRELVADGELVEDGTEVVDGRELIRLRGEGSEGGAFVVLVDPETYRVVGQRGTMSSGETYTTAYDYLPRTLVNLDLVHPPIPDGFTQIDPSEFTLPQGSCDGA